ncbi:hypothetical protein OS11_06540 [Dickeya oryzae]
MVYIGSLLTTGIWLAIASGHTDGSAGFTGAVALWLWVTVLFANFAEALAEGRSKAQAEALKGVKKTSWANKLTTPHHDAATQQVPADSLRKGDIVLVSAGEMIPCDGEVLEGGASVDESAITGESAPVIRESGGDFASVTGGTRVLSDWLVIQCTVNPGETFIDRMIAMVENAKRRKTPNEVALTILLVELTIIFLLVVATLSPFSWFSVLANNSGSVISITVLVALLVCLIPTTIGGLLSAIGIAGMSRMLGANVIATSGRAVEALAILMCCCWTKPAPSRSAIVRRQRFCLHRGSVNKRWPMRRNWRHWRMKRRKVAVSWCWRNNALACVNARYRIWMPPSCRSQHKRA